MNWYNYLACFFAGAFLAKVVPHFVDDISGDHFPTPFGAPTWTRTFLAYRQYCVGVD
jgi:hypothetical protein